MTELLRLDALFLLLAAPCIGSFLGVLVDRLPAGRTLVLGRSACDHCGTTLAPRDLVPVLGWLANRGRCRYCQQPIAARYPAIELAALGLAFWSLAVLPGWLAWAGAALGWTLLTASLIDWQHMILPDRLTLPLIPAGLAVIWLLDPARLSAHLVGALAGFGLVLTIALLYRRLRGRDGIGLGDAKLLAAAGAWVSWEGLPSIILLASTAGLLAALLGRLLGRSLEAQQELPFGPYLAAGFWLTWLYGPLVLT